MQKICFVIRAIKAYKDTLFLWNNAIISLEKGKANTWVN